MTLTEFLLARIAADEAVAHHVQVFVDSIPEQDAAHGKPMLGFSPARIVAECDAKRRIVDAHWGQVNDDDDCAWIVRSEVVLRALALPYADHPDYQQEWAP